MGRAAIWFAVLAPAVIQPGGFDRFVLATTVAVGVAVLLGLRASPAGRLPRWASWGLVAGAGVLVVDALLGAAPSAQLWGRWPRYEGLLTLPATVGALWLGARLLGPRSTAATRRDLERAAVVLVALVGVVAALEAVGLRPLASSSARPGSLLGNASDQGVVGVLAVAMLLVPVVRSWLAGGARARSGGTPPRRPFLDLGWVRGTALALGGLTVVLSGSRGALVALAVLLVAGAAGTLAAGRWSHSPAPARAVGLWTAGALGVTALAALAVPATAARVVGASPSSSATVEGRSLLWSQTWRLILDHPWTGVGPSGFVDAIPAYHSTRWALEVGPANPPDSPHSWLLQSGAVGGLPLLALAVGLSAAGLVAGVRRIRATAVALAEARESGARRPSADDAGRLALLVVAWAAVAATATALAVHVTSPLTTAPAALVAGALIARDPAAGPSTRPVRLAGLAAVVAWLVVLLPATAAEWPLQTAYDAIGDATSAPADADARADAAFGLAQTLRPWDADVAMLAAHAFATRALAGDRSAVTPTGRWADAALARVPRSTTALAAASAAAEMSGDLTRAETLMTRLVDGEPTNAEWLLRRGVIRAEAGDTGGAEDDFLAATRLAPSAPDPWRNLAVLYRQLGDRAAADHAEQQATARSG